MQFPEDSTLIARGKYATLSGERKAQLKRVQDICRTVQAQIVHVLRDCEVRPPVDSQPLQTIEKCIPNLKDARERIVNLSNELAELHSEAWE